MSQTSQAPSASLMNTMLDIMAARNISCGHPESHAVFQNMKEVHAAIDDIQAGDAPWKTFTVKYTGEVNAHSPSWMRQEYIVHTRNALTVAENMAASEDFHKSWDYVPFREFIGEDKRRYSNFMSGDWAWKKAVSSHVAVYTECLCAYIAHRRRSARYQARRAACCALSSSALTRRPSR